jgi:hypothetical protein
MDENVFGSTAMAVMGSVATQAVAGGATIQTPMGDMQGGILAGIGGVFLSTKVKKKKNKRRLFFASLGAVCGQAAVQTYKMEIDVFGLQSANDAEATAATAAAA